MFKFFKRKRNKKGFTLVEVLTVMFVVAAIAAVALPSYKRAMEKSRATQGVATLESIAKAQTTYNALRGRYSPNFNSLPLDLRDKDSKTASGQVFTDDYFQFTLNNNSAIAVAARSNGEYELTVDYVTGKIYCSPMTHAVCARFGYEERPANLIPEGEEDPLQDLEGEAKYTSSTGDGSYCYAKTGRCFDKEGKECTMNQKGDGCSTGEDDVKDKNLNGLVCYKEEKLCYLYEDGIPQDSCDINEKGDGCVSDGWHCDKKECREVRDGKYTGNTCDANKEGTACKDALNGWVCGNDGKCAEYKDGEFTGETCKANKEGTGCKEDDGILEGWVCEKGKNACYLYEDDKAIDKCIANADYSGCLEDGKLVCREDGLCWNSIGERCIANKDGSDCEKGLICAYNDGWFCKEFEGGKLVQSCVANEERTGCLKDGEMVCRGDKGCMSADGGWCEANAEGTGCKDGVGGSCSVSNLDACKTNKYTGTVCTNYEKSAKFKDPDKDKKVIRCYTFVDGVNVSYCEDGSCKNVVTGEACTANSDGTDCAEEVKPTTDHYACDGNKCVAYDVDGNEIKTCYKDEPACFKEYGIAGTLCDTDSCTTYDKDGNLTAKCWHDDAGAAFCDDYVNGKYSCPANEKLNGCKDAVDMGNVPSDAKNGLYCDKESKICYTLEDGKIKNQCTIGKDCDSIYDAILCDKEACYVIEGGKDKMYCKKSGKCYDYNTHEFLCDSNETFSGCKDGNPDGDKEGWVCNGWNCAYYKDGVPTGEVCYNNGNNACIDTQEPLVVCIDGTCKKYKEGKPNGDECIANAEGTGCDSAASFSCNYDTKLCIYYNEDLTGQGCYITDYDCYSKVHGDSVTICSPTSPRCDTYEDGNLAYECNKETNTCKNYKEGKKGCVANKEANGCAVGWGCLDGTCYNYDKDGKLVGSCEANDDGTACAASSTSSDLECKGGKCVDSDGNTCYDNGSGQCIKGEGTEIACIDKRCAKYENGVEISICESNTTHTGCSEQLNGFICKDHICFDYEDGFPIFNCYNDGNGKCIKKEGEQVVCYADSEECHVYKEGNFVTTCPPNDTFDGCKGSSTGSSSGSDITCSKNKCTYYDEDGNAATCYSNNAGDGCITGEGIELGYCDGKTCRVYVDGEATKCTQNSSEAGGCDRNGQVCDGVKCWDYAFGKKVEDSFCYNNGEGGCIKGEGTETVCIGGKCNIYENGIITTEGCEANAAGTGCKTSGGDEWVCNGATCVNGNGEECTANATGDDCAGRNGLVCNGEICTDYKDGVEGKTCFANDKNNGCIVDGQACSDDKCFNYANGELVDVCYVIESGACVKDGTLVCEETNCNTYIGGKGSFTCYNNGEDACIKGKGYEVGYCDKDGNCNVYANGIPSYLCKAGSSEEGGCELNGFECTGQSCKNYIYGQQAGSQCFADNSGKACITGEGYELGICTSQTQVNGYDGCYVYLDGASVGYCSKGNSCDKNGFICSGEYCAEYKFGYQVANTRCITDGEGGCIKGEGWEVGYCNGSSCQTYLDGKRKHVCTKDSSDQNGCDRNGMVCDLYMCYEYIFGSRQGDGCYNNGKGGCINGVGYEIGICPHNDSIGVDVCYVYKDGDFFTYCGTEDSMYYGTCSRNGRECDTMTCTDYLYGKVMSSCKNNGYNECITGVGYELGSCVNGRCVYYKNGSYAGSCTQGPDCEAKLNQ